ncbi:carbohydrate kinase family protein [Pseudaminobacter soli (ex Li et al. 2025)]|uniref:Carbohydrate kinase family protein n=1 Tax=Pseudaminobacter soli (ex Li et al. 2025) TaxID=1295366 RepID=A0A2P7RNJ4_9HYPH|nr:carbohydrate kinase family protein [Mesorhizobium soli]PSJ51779.1 carbohydrate kinase family protein [Mesorhizobium soli]
MTTIAITGYASLDHVAILDGSPQAGLTTTILQRPQDGWPRLGGGPAFVAMALTAAGIENAVPVSWIGDDAAGQTYRDQLSSKNVSHEGLEAVAGARTPVSVLAYEPDGGCICLYDPGMPTGLKLSPTQKELIANADWVCVTIGPSAVNDAVLDAIGDATRLAWIVKHDPRAMSATQAARFAARADLICFSHAESAFVQAALDKAGTARSGRILIETRGRQGATITRDGQSVEVSAEPISVTDPTGAGDSFAGGVLAALAQGETDPEAIVRSGHAAARRLLLARQTSENESALRE